MESLKSLPAMIGTSSCAIGIGISLALVGVAALNGIARQPEAAQKLQTAMLIIAALIEGFGLFCAVMCFMAL